MAATTTPSINSILSALKKRLTHVTFVEGADFSWNPHKSEVTYNEHETHAVERLLHESGHALCEHASYSRDITLLEMERDAWEAAKLLSEELGVTISDTIAQDYLDEYRLWMHARSTCPTCSQIGIQDTTNSYACPLCRTTWTVNDARTCQLRRYKK